MSVFAFNSYTNAEYEIGRSVFKKMDGDLPPKSIASSTSNTLLEVEAPQL